MGRRDKFNERKKPAYLRELKSVEPKTTIRLPFIVLSFRNFDRNQGQKFEEWEQEQILALAVNK
jgi:hypothetical protein